MANFNKLLTFKDFLRILCVITTAAYSPNKKYSSKFSGAIFVIAFYEAVRGSLPFLWVSIFNYKMGKKHD